MLRPGPQGNVVYDLLNRDLSLFHSFPNQHTFPYLSLCIVCRPRRHRSESCPGCLSRSDYY